MNIVHDRCMEKYVCDNFSGEIVNMTARIDPIKRTIVYVPEVIKKEGSLRWIGDLLVNGVSWVSRAVGLPKLARRLGLTEPPPPSDRLNRRKGRFGAAPQAQRRTLISLFSGWAGSMARQIPTKHYVE